jgi:hypothetical protein
MVKFEPLAAPQRQALEQLRRRAVGRVSQRAPEHNPIERVGGLLKDAVAANRLHGSIEELVAAAARFVATPSWAVLAPTPAGRGAEPPRQAAA